jgi:hypothetical protein
MTERSDRLIVLTGATIAAVGFEIPLRPVEYVGVLLAVFSAGCAFGRSRSPRP